MGRFSPQDFARPAIEWWRKSRYPRPLLETPDEPTIRRISMALRSEVLNATEKTAKALAHIVWAFSSWARRTLTPEGWRVQVTGSYVQVGAGVGRRAAEQAMTAFRRWTGVGASRAGWYTLSPEVVEACWIVLGEVDCLIQPEVVGSELVPVFAVCGLPPRGRGKTHCGCPAHLHGDRDPSLLYDLEKGLATCMVTRQTFVLVEEPQGLMACEVCYLDVPLEEGDELEMDNNNTLPEPSADPQATPPTDLPFMEDLDKAGRPGPNPVCSGLCVGKLWPSGLIQNLSKAKDRSAWARWQASRWGGGRAESAAWDEACHREVGGTPREICPDRLVGVGWWRPTTVVWQEGKGGRQWPTYLLEERGTGHVLFDIDKTGLLPRELSKQQTNAIRQIVDDFGILGRTTWIMRTSNHGVQVLVKLKRFRWDPSGFYRNVSVQRFLRFVGERLATLLGGVLDPSAFAPKRFGRAPGWRTKDGPPECATIAFLEG